MSIITLFIYLFFLIALLTFYTKIGALLCIYALFKSFMIHRLIDSLSSLLLFFFHLTIILHYNSLFISFVPSFVIFIVLFIYFIYLLFIIFYAMSNDLSHFSAWRMVISPSTLILWTLVQRSLVKRDILLEIVRLHHCLRVYPFNYVFLVELIC